MARRRFQSPKLQKTKGVDPKWYCRYYRSVKKLDGTEERIEDRRYFGAVDRIPARQAKIMLRDFAEELNKGAYDVGVNVTVGEWIDEWWTLHQDTLKATSRILYENQIRKRIQPFFRSVHFADLDRVTVQRWMNEQIRSGLAYKTRKTLAGILRAAITMAEDASLYDGPNLFRRLNYGVDRAVHEERLLTWDEYRRLLPWLPGDVRQMATIAVVTGLRFCEIVGLTWRHIDFARDLILVRQRKVAHDVDTPKSKSGRRDVPLQGLRPLFEALPRQGEFLFPQSCSKYKWDLKRAAQRSGIDWYGFGWHSFRRLYATQMNASGANLVDLSRSLGHATTDQTLEYIKGASPMLDARGRLESEVIQ